MATDDLGNVQVDFAWGNMPLQPNDDRDDSFNDLYLNTGGNHDINATSWNQYPEFKGSRNYMVTGVEYLEGPGNIYEYTSYNELKVGEYVTITNSGWGNTTNREVIYADHLKFRISDELGEGKLTGLRGRVDVEEPYDVGRTRFQGEGEKTFVWPQYGLCLNEIKAPGNRWFDMIEYLRACGVDPERLREATFVGGEDKYDHEGGEYDGGIIFWDYINPNEVIYVDWETGYVLTGKDFDGHVIATSYPSNAESAVNPQDDLDLSFVAFTNDPAKGDTANWWY